MSEAMSGRAASQKMLTALQASGAIDHEKLGKVIAETMPSLLQPGTMVEDGDYVAKGYSSVVTVYKMVPQGIPSLENVDSLKTIGASSAP